MTKKRLDVVMAEQGLVASRSQAESYIKLGLVRIDGNVVRKPGQLISQSSKVNLTTSKQYVSRAGMKLASVVETLQLDFHNTAVLDVGSSTGGFTDYVLQHGATKVIAVDSGTNQLHSSLRTDSRIELHEQTDIRSLKTLSTKVAYVLIDVSFISVRLVLPSIAKLIDQDTLIVVMLKPQFEVDLATQKHKGVIKNNVMRRQILKEFELWTNPIYKTLGKADSAVSGEKGNRERFYLLQKLG